MPRQRDSGIQWYTNQDRAGCDITPNELILHTCKCLAQPLCAGASPFVPTSGPASAARHMHLRLSGTLRHHRRTAPLMCGHKKGRRIDDRSSHEQRRSHGRSANVCLSLQDPAAPAQAAHTSPSGPQHPGAGRQRQRTYNSSRWPHGAPPLSLRLLRRRRFEWCIAHTDRILHDW